MTDLEQNIVVEQALDSSNGQGSFHSGMFKILLRSRDIGFNLRFQFIDRVEFLFVAQAVKKSHAHDIAV